MANGELMGPSWNLVMRGNLLLLKKNYKTHIYRLLRIKELLLHDDEDLNNILRDSNRNRHHAMLVMHQYLGKPCLDTTEVATAIPTLRTSSTFHGYT